MKEEVQALKTTAPDIGDSGMLRFYDTCISRAIDNWASLFIVQEKFRHLQRNMGHKRSSVWSVLTTDNSIEIPQKKFLPNPDLSPVIKSPPPAKQLPSNKRKSTDAKPCLRPVRILKKKIAKILLVTVKAKQT